MASPYINSVSFGNSPNATQLAQALQPETDYSYNGLGGASQQQGQPQSGGFGGMLKNKAVGKLASKLGSKLFGHAIDPSATANLIGGAGPDAVFAANATAPATDAAMSSLAADTPALPSSVFGLGGGGAGVGSAGSLPAGYTASINQALGADLGAAPAASAPASAAPGALGPAAGAAAAFAIPLAVVLAGHNSSPSAMDRSAWQSMENDLAKGDPQAQWTLATWINNGMSSHTDQANAQALAQKYGINPAGYMPTTGGASGAGAHVNMARK